MMQDSLARALGTLKGARMDDVAADEVRKRLEHAWAERAMRRHPRFVIPGFARAFAVAALVVFVAFSTMRAAAAKPRPETPPLTIARVSASFMVSPGRWRQRSWR